MANSVRYIKAVGVFERFDLEQEFQPGVNILYGRNGTGKTTLLQILANILNGDFERFAFLPFETIDVHLDKNKKIRLHKYVNNEESKIEACTDPMGLDTKCVVVSSNRVELTAPASIGFQTQQE